MTVKELKEILDEIEDPNTKVFIEHEVRGKVGSTRHEVNSYETISYLEDYDLTDDFVLYFKTDYKLVPKMD
jgi:hypothetical protein